MIEDTVEVAVPEHDDEDVVTFEFKLEEAEDVCRMFVSSSNAAGRRGLGYIGTVLRAQADMIAKGLHLDSVKAPHFMLDIAAFHQKFGLEYPGKPRILDQELYDFREKFIDEEVREYRDEQPRLMDLLNAEGDPDHRQIALGLHEQLDARIDQLYVVLGAAYLQFGVEIVHEAWRRVHAANMAKVRAETSDQSKRGSTLDVVKPKGWMPPDHHDLVREHAHILYRHQVEEKV